MPGKHKGKLNYSSEDKKKLYHNIREFRKVTQSGMEKLNGILSGLPERMREDNRRKERRNPFKKDRTEIIDIIESSAFSNDETVDIPTKIDKKIRKFYYKDTGFKNQTKALVEDVEVYIRTSNTMESLYIIAYNSRLSMMEYLFASLKNDIAEIDPDNEYVGYLENPIYKLAEEFTQRIKDDRLDQCEGTDFETYSQRLRLYADDLNKRTAEILKGEEV